MLLMLYMLSVLCEGFCGNNYYRVGFGFLFGIESAAGFCERGISAENQTGRPLVEALSDPSEICTVQFLVPGIPERVQDEMASDGKR